MTQIYKTPILTEDPSKISNRKTVWLSAIWQWIVMAYTMTSEAEGFDFHAIHERRIAHLERQVAALSQTPLVTTKTQPSE